VGLPLWRPEDWCHPECYCQWSQLTRDAQGFLGGHVHFEDGSWRVPNPRPPLMVSDDVGYDIKADVVWE
jgi:hypothetical protein